MSRFEHVDETARLLAGNWGTGHRLSVIEDRLAPPTLDDAYAVQDRLVELLGHRCVGWKLALTDPGAPEHWGLSEPTSGRLFEGEIRTSPARVQAAWYPAGLPVIEVEIALRIGTTLTPEDAPHSPDAVRAAIASYLPCVELPTLHFEDLPTAGFLSLIADNTGGRGVVVGVERPFPETNTGDVITTNLLVDGEPFPGGTGATTLDETVARIAWLAGHLSARGLALEAGALVSTGAITGPHWLEPTADVVADLGPTGSVEVTFR